MQKTLTLVVGLGKTGLSISNYLNSQNESFVMFDTREHPDNLVEFKKIFPNATVYLKHAPLELLSQVHTIISSPGISLESEFFQKAKELNIPIIGDIECFARVVSQPVIAITGTNGKSTVTTLVGEMGKAAGLKTAIAGNIGTPVLDRLKETYDLWVLELSSFQLELTESLTPLAATILNISPDHLDRHHTMVAYWEAKQRIYLNAEYCLYNREDVQTRPDSAYGTENQQQLSYGLNAPSNIHDWGILKDEQGKEYIAQGKSLLFPVESLKIKGRHNLLNAVAACALATCARIPLSALIEVLNTFTGLPHRCQWVRELAGITWINDSKGTNVGATLSAVTGIGSSIHGKIILIAGGQGKGADFTILQEVVKTFVRDMILIGQDADILEQSLKEHVSIIRTHSLEEAVVIAKQQAQPGDVVLLSPACASLDMFKDFNHRGEVFTKAVVEL